MLIQNNTKQIAAVSLPQPAGKVAALLIAIENQYAGAYIKSRTEYQSGVRLEVWAPVTAELQILDDDLDDVLPDASDDDDEEYEFIEFEK